MVSFKHKSATRIKELRDRRGALEEEDMEDDLVNNCLVTAERSGISSSTLDIRGGQDVGEKREVFTLVGDAAKLTDPSGERLPTPKDMVACIGDRFTVRSRSRAFRSEDDDVDTLIILDRSGVPSGAITVNQRDSVVIEMIERQSKVK